LGWVRWVGPRAQPRRKGLDFFLFSKFIFNAKTILEKSRNCFKGMKNTQKIQENLEKFPEIDWDMNNRNKVFGSS
jgi:hypothetical protein